MGHRVPSDRDGASRSVAVANPVRERVVAYLLSVEDDVGMPLVVNEVARFIAGRGAASVREFTLDRVRRDLETEHVPVLVEAGLVTYDRGADVLALAVSTAAARRALDGRPPVEESSG